MQFIIAEKPSASRAVAAVLGASERKNGYLVGGGYIVSWCLGHLLELEHAAAYDEKYKRWRYADLPIIPQNWKRAAIKDKEKQLRILRELANRTDVDTICKCYSKKGPKKGIIIIEKSPTRPPKPLRVVG